MKQTTVKKEFRLTGLGLHTGRTVTVAVRPAPADFGIAFRRIDFDANQLTATIEDISDKLDPLLKRMWGPHMYRIVLTVNSNQLKNKIQYTIR